MKTLSKAILCLLVPAMCLAMLCCRTTRTGKVCDYGVIRMRKSHCGALWDTLHQYDKSLYFIRTFNNGNIVPPDMGTLTDLKHGLVDGSTTDAHNSKFTGCAIQAGYYGTSSTNQVPIKNVGDLPKLKAILDCNKK